MLARLKFSKLMAGFVSVYLGLKIRPANVIPSGSFDPVIIRPATKSNFNIIANTQRACIGLAKNVTLLTSAVIPTGPNFI